MTKSCAADMPQRKAILFPGDGDVLFIHADLVDTRFHEAFQDVNHLLFHDLKSFCIIQRSIIKWE